MFTFINLLLFFLNSQNISNMKLLLTLIISLLMPCILLSQSNIGIPVKGNPITSFSLKYSTLQPGVQMPGIGVEYCSHGKQQHLVSTSQKPRMFSRNAMVGPDGIDEASGYDVKYMRMNLNIDPAVLYLSGSVATVFEARKDVTSIEMQLITAFTVDSIIYQGSPLTFQHEEPWTLTIQFPQILETGTQYEIVIYYRGEPDSGQGFGSVGIGPHGGIPAFWTLSEPYGARDWWPGKNDLTDKIDSVDIIVNSPEAYRTASLGLLVNDVVVSGTRTNHWKHNYPVVPYLVAVAVTNYAVYTDTSYSAGRMVPIINYVYPEKLNERKQETKITAEFMALFSDLFTEYPFIEEKYGHAEFGWGGGMEHQTMSFMGRFDFDIIAHELAHQWFGDMVTLNSWHDIWLNEGFATYLTGLAYENLSNDLYWPIWKTNVINAIVSQPGGSVYVPDTTNVSRIFSSRLSYYKGAMVLHGLRWTIGDSAFFAACRNYLNDPVAQYGFASTEMLKDYLEEAGGIDLTEYFEDWYYGEGYPSYVLSLTTQEDQTYHAELSQTTSHPSVDFFEMKVPVLLSGEGRDTLVIFNHTSNNQVYQIDPGFTVESITIDPEKWIISANNQVLLDSSNPNIDSRLRIYPNPASDRIRITANNKKGNLIITDLKGSIVMKIDNFDEFQWHDVSHLQKGMYLIRLSGKDFVTEAPFVKL